MEFSRNLKFLLDYRKVSPRELAADIGVKANTISNYINSVSKPSFELLEKIIKILDVSSDEILYQKLDSEYFLNCDKKLTPNFTSIVTPNSEKTVYKDVDRLHESNEHGENSNDIEIQLLRKLLEERERLVFSLNETINSKDEAIKAQKDYIEALQQRLGQLEGEVKPIKKHIN